MNIPEMLARNARTYPDNVALVERTPSKGLRKEITWKQLEDRVNRVANALLERGVEKGDRIIHWMMNSINWLEAYLGIIRTGAWAVPLNFRFTREEFTFCAEAAEPKVAILDEEFMGRVEPVRHRCGLQHLIVTGEGKTRNTENFEDVMASSSEECPKVPIADEDPCSLYFTSGTTGAPKPILLSHKNLECAAITEVVHRLREPEDIFIILKPLYHTGDKIHWLASLSIGATAVIQKEKITPHAIFEAIHDERATVAMLLVPWLQDILTAVDKGEIKPADYDLSCWRLVLLGAQPVSPILVQRWKELFPQMQYEINYGLTEASGPGCIHLGLGNEHKLGALGKPGFNWEVRIVDDEGRDVPRGEPGEIIVKGNGVMIEYYMNPKMTLETIRDGWLYTGDMGKMDEDGFVWPCDRKKDIISYGGENIYPAEVEEVLQAHPFVQDVGVIGIPDERLGEIVAAIICLKAGAPESVKEDIKGFYEDSLPRYKRPRQIVFEKVLRSPTGKLEKAKMREKYFS